MTTEKHNTVNTTMLYVGLLGFGSGIPLTSLGLTTQDHWFLILVLGTALLVAGALLIATAFENV